MTAASKTVINLLRVSCCGLFIMVKCAVLVYHFFFISQVFTAKI